MLNDPKATVLLLAGLALLTIILLRRSYRYFGRRKRNEGPMVKLPRGGEKRQPLIDAPPDILRWQVEMQDTARDLKAELDSKMAALGHLVRSAETAVQRLEETIARTKKLSITRSKSDNDENV